MMLDIDILERFARLGEGGVGSRPLDVVVEVAPLPLDGLEVVVGDDDGCVGEGSVYAIDESSFVRNVFAVPEEDPRGYLPDAMLITLQRR